VFINHSRWPRFTRKKANKLVCLILKGGFHYTWNSDWNRDWNLHMSFHYAWALPIFQHSATGYMETAMFVLQLILVNFSQNSAECGLLNLKNQSRFQSQKSSSDQRSDTGYWNSRVCSILISITKSITISSIVEQLIKIKSPQCR